MLAFFPLMATLRVYCHPAKFGSTSDLRLNSSMAFTRRRGRTGADGDEVYGKTFRPLSEWTFARKDQLYQELEFKRFS